MELVTAVPIPQDVPGLSKTPAKPNAPTSGVGKGTPDSGKKSQPSTKQLAGLFWRDSERGKEDAEACKQEKHPKKPTRPVLSLDHHEDSITNLTSRAAPSRVLQPPSKAPSRSSKDQGKTQREHMPVADPSDDEPLLDQANEPKAKSRKWDPTPELVVLDDYSTPLPGKIKTTGKKSHTYNAQEEEASEALCQHLKGEARATQYNLELAILTDYWNLNILNLKGPPNTDNHSQYLSKVKDVSWSYPVKGNVITTRQFFKELQATKNWETIEQGGQCDCRKRACLGFRMRASKPGPSRPSTLFGSSVASRA